MASPAVETPQVEQEYITPNAHSKNLFVRVLRFVFPDKRKSSRQFSPPLIAQLGICCTSKQYTVRDVSETGVYLLTHERWLPGTEMPISLRRTNTSGAEEFVTVESTVVRNGDDGVGFRFLLADSAADASALEGARWVSKDEMARFLRGIQQPPIRWS